MRHLQDDLRYALRKLPDPIDLNMQFDEAVPLIKDLPEYKAIDDEEGRRSHEPPPAESGVWSSGSATAATTRTIIKLPKIVEHARLRKRQEVVP